MGYTAYQDRIAFTYEIPGLYDGWSIAVLTDRTVVNRWAEDDGSPRAGLEHRCAATRAVMHDPDFTAFIEEYFDEGSPDLADLNPATATARKEGSSERGIVRTPPPEGSEG